MVFSRLKTLAENWYGNESLQVGDWKMNSRQKLARQLLAMRRELKVLRDGTIMAHGFCCEMFVQSDKEMRRRARVRLARSMNQSEYCRRALGYQNTSIPEN
jgi:hypothetical protein